MAALHNKKLFLSDDDIFINNLFQLLKKHNINEAELSRQTNIPQSTLHKIFSGKTTDPRISTIRTLADFFNVTLDELYSDNILHSDKSVTHGQSVPIIGWKDCLNVKSLVTTLTPSNWNEWVVIEQINNNFIYGLAARPCMEPRFPKGTLFIINPDHIPEDGDLIVVYYPNTNEATLRELSIDGPNKLLTPVYSGSPPDKLDTNIKIVGTVLQSRFSFQQ